AARPVRLAGQPDPETGRPAPAPVATDPGCSADPVPGPGAWHFALAESSWRLAARLAGPAGRESSARLDDSAPASAPPSCAANLAVLCCPGRPTLAPIVVRPRASPAAAEPDGEPGRLAAASAGRGENWPALPADGPATRKGSARPTAAPGVPAPAWL